MLRWFSVVVATIAVAGSAAAQPADAPAPDRADKSLWSAYLLTAGATTMPMALIAVFGEGKGEAITGSIAIAGMVLGPSAGHWYVGRPFTTGLVLRAGSAVAVGALVAYDPHLDHPVTSIAGLLGAVALWEVGVIWDLVTLPRAVRRHNKRRRLQLVPMASDRGPVAGLAVAGSF